MEMYERRQALYAKGSPEYVQIEPRGSDGCRGLSYQWVFWVSRIDAVLTSLGPPGELAIGVERALMGPRRLAAPI